MVGSWILLVLASAGAYLLGSIPTAYLVVRMLKGIDLRRYGSGNVGASNASVHLGKGALLVVGVVDLAKGALPVVLLRWLGVGVEVQALAGLAVVAGHNWSLYLRLTGGRDMAAATGVLLALGLPALVAFGFAFLMAGLLLRDSGVWMGLGAALLPGVALALGQPPVVVLLCTGLVGLLVLKRLTANGEPFPSGLSRRRVLLHRLVYDRDIRDRKRWVARSPAARPPHRPRGKQ